MCCGFMCTCTFVCSSFNQWDYYLDGTRQSLFRVSQERDRLQREKEEEVATLNTKLHAMERSYEAILQVQIMKNSLNYWTMDWTTFCEHVACSLCFCFSSKAYLSEAIVYSEKPLVTNVLYII